MSLLPTKLLGVLQLANRWNKKMPRIYLGINRQIDMMSHGDHFFASLRENQGNGKPVKRLRLELSLNCPVIVLERGSDDELFCAVAVYVNRISVRSPWLT